MEKVEIEFRYLDKQKKMDDCSSINKFIVIGLYDTIEEAVQAGNEALITLSNRGFELRTDDNFKVNGLFGYPNRLVSNTCYKDKVTFFAKITNIGNNDLNDIIDEALKARKRYEDFKQSPREEN